MPPAQASHRASHTKGGKKRKTSDHLDNRNQKRQELSSSCAGVAPTQSQDNDNGATQSEPVDGRSTRASSDVECGSNQGTEQGGSDDKEDDDAELGAITADSSKSVTSTPRLTCRAPQQGLDSPCICIFQAKAISRIH